MTYINTVLALMVMVVSSWVAAAPNGTALSEPALGFAQSWAHIQYELNKSKQESAFKHLLNDMNKALAAQPDSAALLTWRGIVEASYAGSKGGLGALSLVKAAKKDLESAIAKDGTLLNGAAYTTLGSLYYQVPGWPISFGDKDKAEKNLKAGLALGPEDIDANYFYADFLQRQGRDADARVYIERAWAASARPNRAVADQGRRSEIEALKKKIE